MRKSSSRAGKSVWSWFQEGATRPKPNAAEIGQAIAKDPWAPIRAMYSDLEKKRKEDAKVQKKVVKQSVSASSLPALDRANESQVISMSQAVSPFQMGEGAIAGPIASPDGKKFRVILIQEGLGNFKDAFYYTKEALITAAPLFEGKKFFVDHPDAAEEINRPERSVRDVAGYFENCSVEDIDGRAALVGDLVVFESAKCAWVRDLLKQCVSYRERHPSELVGLSINAGGEAEDWELEEFIRKQRIPAQSLSKLNDARDKGITIIKVVKQFQSAVSCDLVTEAGAGGRIIKMLEQEKSMSKKIESKAKQAEEKKIEGEEAKQAEESKQAEGEEKKEAAEGEEKKVEGEEAADHADEEQDIELIKKMLKKHLGDKEEPEEAEIEMCKQAYKAAQEWGLHGEEAEKAACYGMKMAKHMSSKQAEGEEKKEAAGVIPDKGGKPGAIAVESEKVVSLTAENAKLRESIKKFETRDHLEKILKESGLPRSVTDSFRKLVESSKSTKEIDEKFAVFKEAYGVGSESGRPSFIIAAEKTEAESAGGGSLSFADCVTE